MKFRITLISVLVAAAAVAAMAGEPGQTPPNPAFAQLKSLAGEWQAKSPWGGHSRVKYEVLAGGSAVVETFSDDRLGAGNEMVTVYTPAGEGVALTHYCMAGNQPQMKAERLADGELKFAFVKAENLAGPEAGHMRTAEFKFLSSDRFVSTWNFFENGKLKSAERMEYTRVQ
jgi:hypothetical protein